VRELLGVGDELLVLRGLKRWVKADAGSRSRRSAFTASGS
jgi:hypothetical protein